MVTPRSGNLDDRHQDLRAAGILVLSYLPPGPLQYDTWDGTQRTMIS